MNKSDFQQIYKEYYPNILKFAIAILRNKDDAEEAVQQVFIKIWEKNDKLSIRKPYAYLLQAVKNEAFHLLKKKKVFDDLNGNEFALEEAGNKDEINQTFLAVKETVKLLPTKCRVIMLLKIEDGLTHDEIADYLSISKKTVENQVTIAFRKIKTALSNKIYCCLVGVSLIISII